MTVYKCHSCGAEMDTQKALNELGYSPDVRSSFIGTECGGCGSNNISEKGLPSRTVIIRLAVFIVILVAIIGLAIIYALNNEILISRALGFVGFPVGLLMFILMMIENKDDIEGALGGVLVFPLIFMGVFYFIGWLIELLLGFFR